MMFDTSEAVYDIHITKFPNNSDPTQSTNAELLLQDCQGASQQLRNIRF